jgi:exoribonuclease-2
VRVTRTTYEEVERRLAEPPFAALREMTEAFRRQRMARGAAELDLPEASVKLLEGDIVIRPLARLASRQMVTDAMLMAGEVAARFAQAEALPIPYASQPEPDEIRRPATLSEMYAYRRLFKPSQATATPGPHFGLGLPLYARATSPLRRYLDLVTHQQLRALVTGGRPLDAPTLAERIGASEAVSMQVRRAERLSNMHWKLAWLRRRPDWQGEGIVVSLEERKAVVLLPELALEARIRLAEGMRLDQPLRLHAREVDLADQLAYFRVLN